MSEINQFERAYRTWPILVEVARNGQRIKYGGLAKKLGIHHRAVRFILEEIQNYCLLEHLPPLTILVENKRGVVGHGFIAWDVDDLSSGLEKAYAFEWGSLPNPFEFASDGATPKKIATAIVKRTISSKDIYAKVRVRGIAQVVFREALLQVYEGRCAFSGFKAKSLLQAAHVLPWSKSKPEDRLSPTNGILLSVLHHRLFDLDWIQIDENYRIQVNQKLVKKEYLSKEESILLTNLNGKIMTLPADVTNWPSKELIAERYKISSK